MRVVLLVSRIVCSVTHVLPYYRESITYTLHSPFIASKSTENAFLKFSLRSSCGAGAAVSNLSSSGIVGGRGWIAFDYEPPTTGTRRSIAVSIAFRLAIHFFLLLPEGVFPLLTALDSLDYIKHDGLQTWQYCRSCYQTLRRQLSKADWRTCLVQLYH